MNTKIILPLFSVWALSACSPSSTPDDAASQRQNTKRDYALDATRYDWPAVNASQALATDLLAQNYYLIFDGSGSMSDKNCANGKEKVDVAKVAVRKFVASLPESSNIGLYVFDHNGAAERVPLGQNKQQILQSVKRVVANGGTPLRSAAEAGYKALTRQAEKQLGYGEYHLVIVTDGEASSNEEPDNIVTTILRDSPVQIHTIGFCIGEGHSLNVPGKTYYAAASNPAELEAGLAKVLAEADDYVLDDYAGANNQ